ncbi:MAG: endonuclease/exonuclease/phosphatase family protein [Bacteroidales bacterium]|nr:endonuclease/exonuclease/phosphatase family protein [Bacteroidales bacterium]MCL2133178.1 endonuclease/exonuclease/phosphatase family protein [Bacteroidales bacterium]
MKFIQHFIGYILKTISVIIAIGLLLSYISVYISPAKFWLPAFFGLFFMPLLVLNFLLGIAWALLRRKIAWVNLIALLPAILYLFLFIQVGHNMPEPSGSATKLMSYNVHLFSLWDNNRNHSLPNFSKYIKEENPDILCLQEMATTDTLTVNQAFSQYPYRYYCCSKRKNGLLFGNVTFSKYPIVNAGEFLFSETSNRCVYTDIVMRGDTIRVYNNHLQSISLNLERTALRIRKEELRNEELRQVTIKLRTAFMKRAQQVDIISAHITSSPYPAIVCGDFNDTPVSYTYRKMKGKLNDCFTKAGRGMPSTYRGFWPAFRIDYILCAPSFQTVSYQVPKVNYSDHYPVIVQLSQQNQ